jgi:hypothetical protein
MRADCTREGYMREDCRMDPSSVIIQGIRWNIDQCLSDLSELLKKYNPYIKYDKEESPHEEESQHEGEEASQRECTIWSYIIKFILVCEYLDNPQYYVTCVNDIRDIWYATGNKETLIEIHEHINSVHKFADFLLLLDVIYRELDGVFDRIRKDFTDKVISVCDKLVYMFPKITLKEIRDRYHEYTYKSKSILLIGSYIRNNSTGKSAINYIDVDLIRDIKDAKLDTMITNGRFTLCEIPKKHNHAILKYEQVDKGGNKSKSTYVVIHNRASVLIYREDFACQLMPLKSNI